MEINRTRRLPGLDRQQLVVGRITRRDGRSHPGNHTRPAKMATLSEPTNDRQDEPGQ
jgi:hypothetical protein